MWKGKSVLHMSVSVLNTCMVDFPYLCKLLALSMVYKAMKDDEKSPVCEKLMRQAYAGFTKLRQKILKEAETRVPSVVRREALVELSECYKLTETKYFEAFRDANEDFKDAAVRVNKQQVEKEILEKVKDNGLSLEFLKDAFLNLAKLVELIAPPEKLSDFHRKMNEEHVTEDKDPVKSPFDDAPQSVRP